MENPPEGSPTVPRGRSRGCVSLCPENVGKKYSKSRRTLVCGGGIHAEHGRAHSRIAHTWRPRKTIPPGPFSAYFDFGTRGVTPDRIAWPPGTLKCSSKIQTFLRCLFFGPHHALWRRCPLAGPWYRGCYLPFFFWWGRGNEDRLTFGKTFNFQYLDILIVHNFWT